MQAQYPLSISARQTHGRTEADLYLQYQSRTLRLKKIDNANGTVS